MQYLNKKKMNKKDKINFERGVERKEGEPTQSSQRCISNSRTVCDFEGLEI